MDRIEFIKTCGFACIGGTALTAILQSCTSTNYFAQTTLTNNQITINKSEFVIVEKNKTIERRYVLVNSGKHHYPVCIYKTSDGGYTALLMKCTHNGCELQPHGDYLVCPCHGSEFTNKGIVQNPPAEENLKTFQIKTDNENIYILL